MRWFGVQGKQSRKQREAQWSSEHAWIQGLSASAAKQLFDELFAAFDDVKRFAKRSSARGQEEWSHKNQLVPELNAVREEWLSVDRSRLSAGDAHTLFEVLRVMLPDIAGAYRVMAGESSISTALSGYKDGYLVYSSDEWIIERVTNCNKLLTKIHHDQWAAGYSVFTPKVRLSFPASLEADRGVRASLVELNRLWVAADKKQLSVEDQHFVDEVAGRYVPDAVRAFQAFSGDELSARKAARVIFLDQLNLMSERLGRIGSPKQRGSLQELEAQAAFLREVTA